jgi:hypothetical protein
MAPATKLTKAERYRLRELAFLRRDIHMAIASIDKIENIVAASIVGVVTALIWRVNMNDPLRIWIAWVPMIVWTFFFIKYLALARNIKLADYYVVKIEESILVNEKGWVQCYHDPQFHREALAARWSGLPEWIKANWFRKIRMRVPRYLFWFLTFIFVAALPVLNVLIPLGKGN